jgi:hypothetical protein
MYINECAGKWQASEANIASSTEKDDVLRCHKELDTLLDGRLKMLCWLLATIAWQLSLRAAALPSWSLRWSWGTFLATPTGPECVEVMM